MLAGNELNGCLQTFGGCEAILMLMKSPPLVISGGDLTI